MIAVRITTRHREPRSRYHQCYAESVQIDTDFQTLPDSSRERVFDARLCNVRLRKNGPMLYPLVRVRDIADISLSKSAWDEPLLYPVGGEREVA